MLALSRLASCQCAQGWQRADHRLWISTKFIGICTGERAEGMLGNCWEARGTVVGSVRLAVPTVRARSCPRGILARRGRVVLVEAEAILRVVMSLERCQSRVLLGAVGVECHVAAGVGLFVDVVAAHRQG